EKAGLKFSPRPNVTGRKPLPGGIPNPNQNQNRVRVRDARSALKEQDGPFLRSGIRVSAIPRRQEAEFSRSNTPPVHSSVCSHSTLRPVNRTCAPCCPQSRATRHSFDAGSMSCIFSDLPPKRCHTTSN